MSAKGRPERELLPPGGTARSAKGAPVSAEAAVARLTPLQADLLRAAFVADGTAAGAWRRWRDAIDWEAHLDHDDFRLLPRTYRNLCEQGVADPLLPRLKGITRQAWFANQRRLRHFHPTLRSLAAAGVELLIVPPTAVLLDDPAAVLDRHAPLACAVRPVHVETAIACLWRAGWRTGVRVPRWSLAGFVLAADRLAWHDPARMTLDLSWQWDASDRCGRFPEEVWARAGRARLANEAVLALDPADAVHDLCRRPVAATAFGRIADLLLLLDAAKAPPDWRRLLARAAEVPVDAAWRDIFAEVRSIVPALVPLELATAGPAFGSRPWSASAAVAAAATGSLRRRIGAQWSAYRDALGRDHSVAGALRHLPGYLMARWQLPTLGRLPRRLVRGIRYEWRDARHSR
jgi:hypothetical protein